MHNILITGANGQLGSECRDLSVKYRKYNFFYIDRYDLDITKYALVEDYLIRNKITFIINCAAYTQVDKAECDVEVAYSVNHLAVSNLARISKKNKIGLIHISTDYVFDGMMHKPYVESDKPNPQSVYGKSKFEGEKSIQKINPPNSIIIRTSWVYSRFGRNYVQNMLKLGRDNKEIKVVFDQIQ